MLSSFLRKLLTLKFDSTATSANPWVVGRDGVLRRYVATPEAVDAVKIYYKLNSAQMSTTH